jgi:DNA-binding transcriptional MerR regulator
MVWQVNQRDLMIKLDHAANYNLNVVLKITGLKPDVLRAWERRYALPQPQRSQGGHRLYSDYDIETIKWLLARQAEGLSIGRAVELWKKIIASGRDPLAEFDHEVKVEPAAKPSPRIEILRQNWLEACLQFDEIKAEEILNHSFALFPMETVITEILQKGLSSLGDLWRLGQASAQQEHFASAMVIRRMESLISAASNFNRDQTVLIGCPPEEWHTFPLLTINLRLRRLGYKVVYLGANTPLMQFLETAALIRPDLVVLAAQQLTTAITLKRIAKLFVKQRIPMAYGGLIFNRIPELVQRIPAYFLGENLDGAVPQIQRILSGKEFSFPDIQERAPYQEVTQQFRQSRGVVESQVMELLKTEDLDLEIIEDVNNFFSSRLAAALEFGDLELLRADLEWVHGLLSERHIQPESLSSYFKAYAHSLIKVLGNSSQPITAWIDSFQVNFEGLR